MKIDIFVKSLYYSEKMELFKLLSKDILGEPKTDNYTSIDDFCRTTTMTRGLFNVLKRNKPHIGDYIELVDLIKFKKCYGVGNKILKEFIELRGY
jgi:hypothetical protein